MAVGITWDGELDPRGYPAHSARPGPGRWAIVLAGGDGTRVRDLTRRIAGDDRPKQFCRLLGERTLLGETRRRVAVGVPAPRTLFSVTAAHERFYAPLLADVPPHQVVVQPENRGTAPAILYALLRIAAAAPNDCVAIFPSDHHVSDDEAFMAHVGAAFEFVAARPDLITLLGITPDQPETEYGGIEPGEPVVRPLDGPLSRVRRFLGKARGRPGTDSARGRLPLEQLRHGGPGGPAAGSDRAHASRTVTGVAPAQPVLGHADGGRGRAGVYHRLPSTDFSRSVLAATPAHLAVLPVRGVDWSDLGRSERVLALRRTMAVPANGVAPPPKVVTAAVG